MRRAVFDASALIVFYNNDRGAKKISGLLADALAGKTAVMMSAVNWGEVYYIMWRERGAAAAQQKLAEIARLPMKIEPVDFEAAKLAAEIKAHFRLPYVDCFVASLAKLRDATIVTADSDFSVLKRQIPVLFI
jgi:predicted nucleic acid-binding protein